MAAINGFKGDYTGFLSSEAKKLLQEYGGNGPSAGKKGGALVAALGLLKEPMLLMLFAVSLVYFLLGEAADGITMLVFVAFMSGISLFQQWRADRTLMALRDLSAPRAKVVRDGELRHIDTREIVPGDLVVVEEGDKIPADGEIIEMYDLGVNESLLTGESETVWKKVAERGEDTRLGMCYAGTAVTHGTALFRVTATGALTECGKIGREVALAPDRPTPLERQTRSLVRICAVAGLCMTVFVGALTWARMSGVGPLDRLASAILSGITVAMAMIPEEFPVILAVFLAMGAWRLARRNAIVRRIPAVETLGAVTVLCVDKTGTLTMNRMKVCGVFSEYGSRTVMRWARLACENSPYDPMETAIVEYATETGADCADISGLELLREYPFNPTDKMMGHAWRSEGRLLLAVKGAPETVIPLCGLSREEAARTEARRAEFAAQGWRVLAVAKSEGLQDAPETLRESRLEFVGLIALADPPRPGVPEAVRECVGAGIRVVMITGDNPDTALAVARMTNIPGERAITGAELETMDEEKLRREVASVNVFSRVLPGQKTQLVKALRDNGEIVAMTGDGVNDAPALRYADIGIAMGGRGTAVAREAADMVLLDDNFTTIVNTVRDGRRIYDNIIKAVGYVLAVHVPIALIALFAPLLGLPAMLLPVHIVLLELIIDPVCSVVFERTQAERDIMRRSPKKRGKSLLSASEAIIPLLQGLVVFAAVFGSYACLCRSGMPVETARGFAFAILVLSNLFVVFINRFSNEFAIPALVRQGDTILFGTAALVLAGVLLAACVPAVGAVLRISPLSPGMLLSALGIALVATFWREALKAVAMRRNRKNAGSRG